MFRFKILLQYRCSSVGISQGYNVQYWHSANDKESEGSLYMIIFCDAHCAVWSNLDQGFGDKQMEHCCPGLHGGPQQKTSMKGNQVEERLRIVLVFIWMTALSLASWQMTTALNRIIMFVKEVSE